MSEPLKFTSKNTYSIPKGQNHYGIPERDWNRLKGMIQKIPIKMNWFQTIYGVCFGIAVTAIFSLIGSYRYNDRMSGPGWLITMIWCIATGSSIFGIAFLVFDLRDKSSITQSKEAVVDEIERMEKAFENC